MPELITIDDVRSAAELLRGTAVRTPLLPCLAGDPDRPLWIKPENLQPTGAFKIRGATNALLRLTKQQRERGVVTHSSGNHAQALAYAAKVTGVPAVVVVPYGTPQTKVDAARRHGAEIVQCELAVRQETAEAISRERGLPMIPPYDHPHVIAGQGTAGLEIAEDLPDVELVLVPVSGGGLLSGVATAVKALCPSAKVVGVEPELAADAQASYRSGVLDQWTAEQRGRTVADGLRSYLSELTLAHLRARVDDIVTVTEDEITSAVGWLAHNARLVAEPSGAVPMAAYLNHASELPRGRTVVLVSGGNLDASLFTKLVS
ncbi:threonine/serine dehydratase [Allokutzneria sp. NRRL B-24872]|uniref:threonine ammonia-lyase n=1 Tax=Allokutzneria sp. NRRL B-24872 TaxID=1137961 RepID=UPI000A38E776|nr:threonine/serine dehydratase [Allokutzneria sp. NRRL B-24872]